jgi:hypothetical protein
MAGTAVGNRNNANYTAGIGVQAQQTASAELGIVRMRAEHQNAGLAERLHKRFTPSYRPLQVVPRRPSRLPENAGNGVTTPHYHRTEFGVDYRFLLGRAFSIDERTYVASALGRADGVDIVRAATQINGEQVMRVFPANSVLEHLLYDEEIVLRPVAFA